MPTINKFFVFSAAIFIFASCASSPYRQPASALVEDTTLAGTRVNPVRYILAPKWKVKIHNGEKTNWADGKVQPTIYAIGTDQGLKDFQARLAQLRNENDQSGIFSKGTVAAIDEMSKLTQLIESRQLGDRDQYDAYEHIAELANSFTYSFEYPVPQKLFILAAPFKLGADFYNPPMTQDAPHSINIVAPGVADLSKVDPPDSSFWNHPGNISSKDLYVGFGRPDLPDFSKPCKYSESRSSYGTHPGFILKCNDIKYKFKFMGETKTGPFISRIVWALGFNVFPLDYVKSAQVEYDRRIFSEYDSRKELTTKITGFGIDFKDIKLQKYWDPFETAVSGAILKDGTKISSKELREHLLKDQSLKAEKKDQNYNTEFESKIKYLVLDECSAEALADNKTELNIGPWNWNELDHPERRETRAFGTLAAFMNMFDMRTDNNKIRFVTDSNGRVSIKHYVSDLGSGLGLASDLLHESNGRPNLLPWKVVEAIHEDSSDIEAASVSNTDKIVDRYQFKGYSVIQANAAFARAQVEDARWLVRKLAQLKETQIQDALIQAGWSAAEVHLYVEKLLSRRDNMVKEFGLENEIPLFRPQGVNQKFSYDPSIERVPTVSTRPQIAAPIDNKKVVNGMIQ